MIVLLTGAPGAGKGTQADLLQEKLGYRKVSTGDALRKHIKAGTKIGKVAGQIVAEGKLVPDDVLFEVLKEELGSNPKEKILLDGYPRNVKQAETLKKLEKEHPVKLAVQLEVGRDELVERLCGRRVCSKCGRSYHLHLNPPKFADKCDACGSALMQRPDDQPEKVSVRLQVYDKETKPVLDYYRKSGLYREIDGNEGPEEVFKKLSQVLGSLH